MTDILNQDKDRKRSEEESKRNREHEIADLNKILGTPEGRRFIWRWLGLAGIFRSSLSQNAMTTQALEGARNIGLQLLGEVNEANTYAFAKMQQEAIAEQKSKKEAKEAEQQKPAQEE